MPLLIHRRPDGTERSLAFGNKPLIIGRLPQSEIQVHDAFISRVHCGVGYVNNQFTLKDLGSTNGTYRNGSRVFEGTLATGDKIQVGNTTLMFDIDSASGNGILREIPQLGSPQRTSAAATQPQVSHSNQTLEVKVAGKTAPSPGPSAS